ncbi:MAG: DUF2804 domain-containing protein [Desulfobacteraceae bacterium]|nr:MAG: DUF2804 domain-containing protein [Desulfobacteraceae bacterium]
MITNNITACQKRRFGMNPEEETRLIGLNGRPVFGIRKSTVLSFNLSDLRIYGKNKTDGILKRFITWFRIKRWQYLGVCNDKIIFGAAIVNLGYMTNMFCYIFDRKAGKIVQFDAITPSGKAGLFEGSFQNGSAIFKNGKASLSFINRPESVLAKISVKGKLDAELHFLKLTEPLCCTSRVGLDGFNYTHKEAGIPVTGNVTFRGSGYEIAENESSGVIDYTLGYLARHTFWNWASGGGFDEAGNRVGFNLVQGVNETGFTENAFWINGNMIKTDVIDFQYSDLNLLDKWRIVSNDGKINLSFYPEGERSADINTGLIASRFHQPFGRFEGILSDGGKTWKINNAAGFTEEHYAKW